MNSFTVLVIIAVVSGIAITLQAQLMGHLDKSFGSLESVFLTYGSGAVIIGLIMLAMRGGNLGAWHLPPWYAYSAGLLGLIIVGGLGYATPPAGPGRNPDHCGRVAVYSGRRHPPIRATGRRSGANGFIQAGWHGRHLNWGLVDGALISCAFYYCGPTNMQFPGCDHGWHDSTTS